MGSISVIAMEEACSWGDIFVTATGNRDVIMGSHMSKMKHNAICCNIGHFDHEIDVAYLAETQDIKEFNIKPQGDRF